LLYKRARTQVITFEEFIGSEDNTGSKSSSPNFPLVIPSLALCETGTRSGARSSEAARST
jgi:hypothetical protein